MFQGNAFQGDAFQVGSLEEVAAPTGLHGRPPRRLRRRGRNRLDKEWCEALELATAIREQLETPQPPQEIGELRTLASDLVEVARDTNSIIHEMARELSSIMKDVSQRRTQLKAAELAAAIEAEIDDEEACLFLLS